ncbi:MAG: universal stress protein [Gammaproteobacteria bacterium]|nr:MAG: universal stress protein [Gammaproteobacteria bacterium]
MALQHYHNILVPVDGSENALRALDYAASLAQAAHLQILLLHVAQMGPVELMKALGYPAAAREDAAKRTSEQEEVRRELAEHVFQAARERLPEGLEVRQMMVAGDPAQVILEQVDKLGNAVIVMGNRGLSEVRELLIGGVSSKVLHHATCPVTIVH